MVLCNVESFIKMKGENYLYINYLTKLSDDTCVHVCECGLQSSVIPFHPEGLPSLSFLGSPASNYFSQVLP